MYTFPPWSLSWFRPSSFLGFPPSRPSATYPQNNTNTSLTSLSIQKKKQFGHVFGDTRNKIWDLPSQRSSSRLLVSLNFRFVWKVKNGVKWWIKCCKILSIVTIWVQLSSKFEVQTLGVTQEQQLLISSARLTDCFPGFDINSAIFPLQRNPLFFKGHHSQCNPSFVVIVRAIQIDKSCLTSHPPNQEETIHCQSWLPGSPVPHCEVG